MNVTYIFPSFPAPTETFAASDLNALADIVDNIYVFSMRRRRKDTTQLLQQYKLRKNTHVDFNSAYENFLACVRHPWVFLWLLTLAFRMALRNPVLAASVVAIAPRTVAIVHCINKRNIDVVHAFWGRHPSLILAVLKRFWPSRYTLSIFVGAYDLVADDELVHLGLASADVHFTHSRANMEYFSQRGVADVRVVKRGIPVSDLYHSDDFDRNTIITASALDPRKRVDLVIEVVHELGKRGCHVSLQVAGGGPDLDRLTALVERRGLTECVEFLGHLPRSEVSKTMARGQIFLFLSEKPSERLPNVVKEALFAGCYVLASRTPGINELLHPAFGTILSSQNPSEIADMVIRAMRETNTHALRRRRLAKRWMTKRWSAPQAMQMYHSAWAQK